jgi:hypothetical protein
MIIDAVSFGISVFDLNMLSRIDTLSATEIALWDKLWLINFVTIPTVLIIVVLVCFWTYRAAANAHSFRKGLETSPPWAVGWYFIPFANLWKPYAAMKDIWRASFSREAENPAPASNPLAGWWTFWILTGISGNISLRLALAAKDVPTFVASAWFGIVSALTGIVAAWLLRSVVIQISRAQTTTHAYRLATAEAAPTDAPQDPSPEWSGGAADPGA